MKSHFLFVAVAMCVLLLLSACAPAKGAVQTVVELPNQLQAAIGLGVLYVVGLLLRGRVPDEFVMEIAGAITVALVTIVGAALKLIPLEFEGIATAILSLLVVLLGSLQVVRGLFVVFRKRQVAERLHLM